MGEEGKRNFEWTCFVNGKQFLATIPVTNSVTTLHYVWLMSDSETSVLQRRTTIEAIVRHKKIAEILKSLNFFFRSATAFLTKNGGICRLFIRTVIFGNRLISYWYLTSLFLVLKISPLFHQSYSFSLMYLLHFIK